MKEVCAERRTAVLLGRQGEHLARCIMFDIADWQDTYGEGSVQLLAQRNGDELAYPCSVSVQNGMARWCVRDVDVAMPGKGRLELQYRVGETVVKTETYRTLTEPSLGEAGPVPPDPEQDWVASVLQAAADAEASARDARNVIKEAITIGENGRWLIGGKDSGVSAIGPQGERGETGFPVMTDLSGAVQALTLANNTDYRCTEPVTHLTVTGFVADPAGRSEVWGIHFVAGDSITVALPETVVWNYNATPVFTPGSEYWLLFTTMLNGKILGVWNEVEA